jgi:hypothetical protein
VNLRRIPEVEPPLFWRDRWREVNIERADILLQISTSFSSGNGNDVVPLGHHPGEGELSGRAAFFCSKQLDPIHQFHISTEILRLETGHAAAPIVDGEIIKVGDPGGQEAPAERTSNLAYWEPKLALNRARDSQARSKLEADGWKVLTVWECETGDATKLELLATMLSGALNRSPASGPARSPQDRTTDGN